MHPSRRDPLAQNLHALYVVVDRYGNAVEAAGPAPFDGRTLEEAEAEARATVRDWASTWRVVHLTRELERQLRLMARRRGL